MKSRIITLLLSTGIILSFMGCQRGTAPGQFKGEEVHFTAGTGKAVTKTVYSGQGTSDSSGNLTWERIDWEGGEYILIWSANATGRSGNSSAEYAVINPTANGNQSKAETLKINEDVLTWGTDETYSFWSIYPSDAGTSTSGWTEGEVTFSIPASQTGTLDGTAVKTDMSKAVMLAANTSAEAGSSVELDFYPAYTAFEVTLLTQSEEITLTDMKLISEDGTTPVAGTISATILPGSKTNNQGKTVGNCTFGTPTDTATEIAYTFPEGTEVTSTQSITFTVLTLPTDYAGVKLQFNYLVNGNEFTQTVTLRKNDAPITFGACEKHRIVGLVMPDSWKFTYLTLDIAVEEWGEVAITESNGSGVQATQFSVSWSDENVEHNLRYVKGNDKNYRQCWVFEPGTTATITYKIMMPISGTWGIEALGDTDAFDIAVTSANEGTITPDGNTFSGALSGSGATYLSITVTSSATDLKTLYFTTTASDGTTTFNLDSETQLYDMRGHHYFIVNGDASTTWDDLNI